MDLLWKSKSKKSEPESPVLKKELSTISEEVKETPVNESDI